MLHALSILFQFLTFILVKPLMVVIDLINHLLARDPSTRAYLSAYAGRTACFIAPARSIALTVQADGLIATAAESVKPDITVILSSAALSAYLQGGRSAMMKQVKIEGDAEFAAALAQLSERLRWEPEEALAQLIGDASAHRIARTARAAHQQTQRCARNLFDLVIEYLLEENPQLLRRTAFEDFDRKVVKLRDDVERLEKRLARLEAAARNVCVGN